MRNVFLFVTSVLLSTHVAMAQLGSTRILEADRLKKPANTGYVAVNNTGVITVPSATDTLVGRATTDTLTNKTINASNNTVTNVSLTTAVTGTLPLGNGGTGQTTAIAAHNGLRPAAQAISASAIDWSTGDVFTKTLGANTTFTFSNQASGQTIVVRLTNTASNYTVTWPSVKWVAATAPTMSTGATSDVYTFVYDGTNTYGSVVQDLR